MKEIAKAVVAVMKSVKGIEKNLTVGEGKMSYKGVADQDVKRIIGEAMADNGLCILPITVDAASDKHRWEESGQYGVKQKLSVFTEVRTKYLLLHESGESIEIVGYGTGIDIGDKSAGKATTYALKYALLYAFMVPTGKIDDAEAVHSDEAPVKKVAPVAAPAKKSAKQELADLLRDEVGLTNVDIKSFVSEIGKVQHDKGDMCTHIGVPLTEPTAAEILDKAKANIIALARGFSMRSN